MSVFNKRTGFVIELNAKFLYAALLGIIGWWLWPSSLEWWGLGILSIGLCGGAVALAIEATIKALRYHARGKEIHEFGKKGAQPKSSQLADDTDLDKAGML